MIKLFRNIRKNLLNEGKTTNYLKYASGEIILVVIGILIALQINNWNEGEKERQEEHLSITNLSKTVSYLIKVSVIMKTYLMACNIYLKFLMKIELIKV